MVGDIFQPTHLLFVLVVALLVLGPKRLPEVGRTLGSGIRDFRQALSGESSAHRHDSDQVGSTTTALRDEPDAAFDEDITWPEEAVGPTSYDEAVEAATAEPATTSVADPPAPEFADTIGVSSTDDLDQPRAHDLDALYFATPDDEAGPVVESSGSPESHTDQRS